MHGDSTARTAPESAWFGASATPQERLAVALDVPSTAEAMALAEMLAGRCRWLKVGMELFYSEGADLVQRLQDRGFRIFLDLKLHDIPNTVAATVRVLGRLKVDMLTIHVTGGAAMIRAAAAEAARCSQAPLLLGVTVLTSMDESALHSVGVTDGSREQVLRLAGLGLGNGLAGLVCSSLEVSSLRTEFGMEPTLIVPGVRPAGSQTDDQSRTSTPEQAIRDGASLLVVGRPITRSVDPMRSVEAILEGVALGLASR